MSEQTTPPTPTFKIHKDKFIYAAAYIGGPLAAGYIIAENFKAFGDLKKYKQALAVTVLLTVLLVTVGMFTPAFDKMPRLVIPLVYTFIAYWIMRWLQGQQIDEHILNDGPIFSAWRAALITLISLVITLALVFILAFAFEQEERTDTYYKPFANTTHQIQYNSAHMEQTEVALLSNRLAEIAYLDSNSTMSLYVDKQGDEIQIWVPFLEPAWTNTFDIERHTQLKELVAGYYPANTVVVRLCDSTWAVKKTIH